jgi:hypothetical protein
LKVVFSFGENKKSIGEKYGEYGVLSMPTILDLTGSASLFRQNEQGCCHAQGTNCLSLELQPHSRYSLNNLSSMFL